METLARVDVGKRPLSECDDDFMELKAPIVIYMMEKYLGKNIVQKVGVGVDFLYI